MYYLNGCQGCELAKPVFKELGEKYPEFTFEQAELLKDKMELYTAHAETQDAIEYLKDDSGEVLRNHSGVPFKKVIKDDAGNTIKEPVLSAPQFYFVGDDEFLGKTGSVEELKSLLTQMKDLLND